MGHGNDGIGRIGRRETAVDLRIDGPGNPLPEPGPIENGGIVPPGQVLNSPEPKLDLPELKDGFIPEPMPDLATSLQGEGAPVLKGVQDLVPDLARLNELGEIAQRFSADVVLLRAQLNVPGIPQPEQVDRLFQFYVAYAERFVEVATAVEAHAGAMNDGAGGEDPGMGGKPSGKDGMPTPKGRPSGELDLGEISGLWGEAVDIKVLDHPDARPGARAYTPQETAREINRFTHVLREAGFSEFRDVGTGKDGAKAAADLLKSQSPRELEQRASRIELRPVHDVRAESHPAAVTVELAIQQAVAPEHARQAARAPDDANRPIAVDGRPELRAVDGQNGMRVQTWAVAASQVVVKADPKIDRPEEGFFDRMKGTSKRLGNRMLWNVLHTFRGDGEDSAVFQDKWDKLTFGAILLLVGVALAVIVLVSL